MNELKQLNLIIEGFRRAISKINSWGSQRKAIKTHLDLMKAGFKSMIDLAELSKGLIKKIGKEDIEKRFGKDSIQKDLLNLAAALREAERGLKDWEAILQKNKKSH
ncbi:MAG: hypothetical protein JXE07_09610 [Candidatus Aminicenantes bacterium]|nr:hypothetical protein [Candidatus Aminicenantes bacterium]